MRRSATEGCGNRSSSVESAVRLNGRPTASENEALAKASAAKAKARSDSLSATTLQRPEAGSNTSIHRMETTTPM